MSKGLLHSLSIAVAGYVGRGMLKLLVYNIMALVLCSANHQSANTFHFYDHHPFVDTGGPCCCGGRGGSPRLPLTRADLKTGREDIVYLTC